MSSSGGGGVVSSSGGGGVVSSCPGIEGRLNCPKASFTVVPPSPRLAGNNKRTPKIVAAIAALQLSLKMVNGSVIVTTILESLILISVNYSDGIRQYVFTLRYYSLTFDGQLSFILADVSSSYFVIVKCIPLDCTGERIL